MTVFVLFLAAAALVLFSLETVPLDLVSLGLLVALMVSGVLTPSQALSGFGNEAVAVLAGLFVLTAALRSSGAVDAMGRSLEVFATGRPRLGMMILLALVAGASALMNNTTCTALFLPLALALARRTGQPPSRLLMPVAFASILGGTLTVIGTSTNVIVRGLLPQYGQPPLGMFELLPVALPIAAIGLVYLWVGRAILPDRGRPALERRYGLRDYLTEVRVSRGSRLAGTALAETDLSRRWDLHLVSVLRGEREIEVGPDTMLEPGDRLLVEGRMENLLAIAEARGLDVPTSHPEDASAREPGRWVEALILPRSALVGRTLRESRFRQAYGAAVLALNRHGEVVKGSLGDVRLRTGDVLLLRASPSIVEALVDRTGLTILSDRPSGTRRPRAAWIAGGVFLAVVASNALGWLPLAAAVLLGCLVLLATRSLTPQEAYAAIDWRLLLLIGAMIAYGTALESTGGAATLAEWMTGLVGGLGPRGVLAAIYLLTLLLTQPMSNQAAALVVFPVAMEAAAAGGVDPRAMAATVALAASSSFLTPLEPSCLLVYGPGGYRFADYPRLGLGLTLLAMVTTLALVPRIWPLQ